MSSDLNLAVKSRGILRRQISTTHNSKNDILGKSEREKLSLEKQIQLHLKNITDLNKEILQLKWSATQSDSEINKEYKEVQEYEEKICDILSWLEPIASASSAGTPAATASNEPKSLLKSPIVQLPTYNSGDEEDLVLFFAKFEDTMAKFSYKEHDKMQLLRQQLTGRALGLVDSIEYSNQTYTTSKNLLLKAMASPEVRTYNTIKKLINMKLDYETEPYK